MTLVELLIALVVLSIGITALVAGFSGGILAVSRASAASNAGVLADQQMEAYRRLSFSSLATDTTTTGAADATYTGDAAFSAMRLTATCPGSQTTAPYYYCNPSRTTATSNGATYRIDSYIAWGCGIPGSALGGTVSAPTCSGSPASRPIKQVTIVVRKASTPAKTLIRVTSTFDALSA